MSGTHDVTISAFDLDQLEADSQEQARLLGMSVERECYLRGELERERALADRLAGALQPLAWLSGIETPNTAEAALAAWKEVRSE